MLILLSNPATNSPCRVSPMCQCDVWHVITLLGPNSVFFLPLFFFLLLSKAWACSCWPPAFSVVLGGSCWPPAFSIALGGSCWPRLSHLFLGAVPLTFYDSAAYHPPLLGCVSFLEPGKSMVFSLPLLLPLPLPPSLFSSLLPRSCQGLELVHPLVFF